jgi:uncharacterized protein (DUF2225 family)
LGTVDLGTGFGRIFCTKYQVQVTAIALIAMMLRNFNKLEDTHERTKNRQNPNCR